jgi:signal transduction histidine kinase
MDSTLDQAAAPSDREQELKLRLLELDGEVSHLNKELDALAHALNQQVRGELRAINLSAHEVLTEPILSEKGRAELIKIGENVHRVNFLIDATLRLSILTRRPLQLEVLDISGIANEIAEEVVRRYRKEAIKLHIDQGLKARGDARLLELAFEKLFDNAVRFAVQGRSPEVRFITQMVNEKQVYCIQDNGPGFNQSLAGRIFDPVMRINSELGSGMGLALVKRVIERHDGKVWAQSRPGQGAAFSFYLGRQEPPEPSATLR